MLTVEQEAQFAAKQIIADVLAFNGKDYTPVLDVIAKHFEDYVWNGNWDTYLELDGFPIMRFMQEDEYDQHMDDETKPDYDIYSAGHYIILDA